MSQQVHQRIDEYKCLRAEIVQFQVAENQWLLGLVTASGAVVGICLAQEAVVPLLIVPLLAFATLERLKSIRYYIFRTAAWISVFVDEPGGLRDTRWESDLHAYRTREPKAVTSPAGGSTVTLITAVLSGAIFAAFFVAFKPLIMPTTSATQSGVPSANSANLVACFVMLTTAAFVYFPLRKFVDRRTSIAMTNSFCEYWRKRRDNSGPQGDPVPR